MGEDAVKVVRTDSHKTVARFKLLGQDIVFEPAESATGNPVVRISTHTECHGGVRGQRCVKVFQCRGASEPDEHFATVSDIVGEGFIMRKEPMEAAPAHPCPWGWSSRHGRGC